MGDVELELLTEINNKLYKVTDKSKEQQWEKQSIYKVPASVADLNKNAYRPQVVSFGPYHHGEAHLREMEDHKERALIYFLRRSKSSINLIIKSLVEVSPQLKDSYHSLDSKWQNDTLRFLRMMVYDGCFMLEILRCATKTTFDDYASKDPIFSSHGKLYIMPLIRRDMLMLENQLPMLLLHKLAAFENEQAQEDDYVKKLILMFCSGTLASPIKGKCLHVLDAYRKSLLLGNPRHPTKSLKLDREPGEEIIGSASELHEAGIGFKKSRTNSLNDISFHRGNLSLPKMVVDDTFESIYLNMIAFERFHVDAGNEVTSFVFFTDNIIDDEKDVRLLHSKGIITNALGSDKAVAKLFNSLSKDITLDPYSSLEAVRKEVNQYCKQSWNEWRAALMHTHFKNPWAILSIAAAIFLFALTIVQTIYTVLQYKAQ